MKKIFLFSLATLFSVISISLSAEVKAILTKKILANTNYTTHLVFPFDVKYFDVGDSDFVALKSSEGASTQPKNVLKLKILDVKENISAEKKTNVTIFTANNLCYNIIVSYSAKLDTLIYVLPTASSGVSSGTTGITQENKQEQVVEEGTDSLFQYKENCLRLLPIYKSSKPRLGSIYKDLGFFIKAINLSDNKYYVVLQINNRSKIDYEISSIKLSIKNKVKSKKIGISSYPIPIRYTYKKIDRVKVKTKEDEIIIFDKIVIDDDKVLLIEMNEKNGERILSIEVTPKDLMLLINND